MRRCFFLCVANCRVCFFGWFLVLVGCFLCLGFLVGCLWVLGVVLGCFLFKMA